MRRTILLVLIVFVFCITASSADARDPIHGCATVGTTKGLVACWKRNFFHADATVKWYGAHASRTIYSSNSEVAVHARSEVRQHVRLRALALRKIAHFRAMLAPRLPWAFWNCVASGWTGGSVGSGSRVSGGEGGADSYNPAGPYYGRYQAGSPFIAKYGKAQIKKYGNADPRTWSVLDQTLMAEVGWNHEHTHGWPQTSPPCVHLR